MTPAELSAQAKALRWVARTSIAKANQLAGPHGRQFVILETFMNELATQQTIEGYINALASQNLALKQQLAAAQAAVMTPEQQQALANYATLEAKINAANAAPAPPAPAANPGPDPAPAPIPVP